MIQMTIMPKSEYLAVFYAKMKKIGAGNMPRTTQAFKSAADVIATVWKGYATGTPMPDGSKPLKSASYAAGVKVQQGGPFEYTIYNDSKMADTIEKGSPQADMKLTHPYGKKSRVSKKGIPYLIIPFRWGTPGTGGHFRNIIPEIYAMLRAEIKAGEFVRTQITGTTHAEPNFAGEGVARAEYKGEDGRDGWGSVLKGVGGNMEGMSAMDTDTGKKAGSGYMTFRIISADSPAGSWIKPAVPPRKITQFVADNTRDIVTEMIQAGMLKDVGRA
jgi:hypothetical protein